MTPDLLSRAVSSADAVSLVTSGMRVFVHGAAATPAPLLDALASRRDVEHVRLYHLHTDGPAPWTAPECEGHFRSVSLFTGPAMREPVNDGRADFVPIFLSDVPGLFTSGAVALDVALVQLSPPDRHGYCSLGTSVDAARAAVDTARFIVAEINDRMPRTHGNTAVPFGRIDAFVHTDRPLIEHPPAAESPVESRIGEIVAGLVEDRATLQMGIGAIPDAVLTRLTDKRDLGIHTEMFSDRLVDLIESGAVTNRFKAVHPGRTVTSFVLGSRRIYDFIDDNPMVEFHGCDRTNDTHLIGHQSARHGDQLGDRDRPHRAGLRGLHGPPHLLRHRRADGLHPRRRPLARRQADHRAAVHGAGRADVAHRSRAQAWRRRGDDARARALGRDRARRRQPARHVDPRAGGGADLDRAPGLPRGIGARGALGRLAPRLGGGCRRAVAGVSVRRPGASAVS